MGLFSFGKNKSKSSSNSSSNTYVDPTQQPYRKDLMRQAQDLNNNGGMPVEGVAGINNNLRNTLSDQYAGGNMIANAGGAMGQYGNQLAVLGYGGAMDYANRSMGSGPTQGAGFAFGAGNQYASGAQGFDAAQGGGANFGMANSMGNSASTAGPASMNAANNSGFNQGNLSNYINNDVLQGQIDASTRDITRNLNENQLTGSASNAAASGNSGSSRRAVMDAIATRGANDRSADIASNMRGNAYNQALGIEAGRASQNAGFQQGANQANANFMQNANQFNAGQQNQLRSQGFTMGGNQLQNNLSRQQQADQYNAGQFNQARQFGTGIGQGAFNSNTANNQFGADMAFRGGAAGVGMQQTGANMIGSGLDRAQASGQYGRDYEQQLFNQQYRQQMAPYNSLNFYNQIVGAPNNLSSATSSSTGKSSGMNFGFGTK
ncbi:MAG: hypothetical protein P8N61_01985 [Porticoccaceae bacterium]|nr:hypothetical protein [Porticoccaceae bacterium]